MTACLRRTVAAARHLAEKAGAPPLLLLVAFALPCPAPGAATIAGIGVLCPVQRFAHLPCPGCGMTRSVVATAHGQLLTAIAFYPIGPLLFVWLVYATVCRVPRLRRILPEISSRWEEGVLALLVIVVLGGWVLLLHLLPGPTA